MVCNKVKLFTLLPYLAQREIFYRSWNSPLPAPATAELLCGIPCCGVEAGVELVTPTGAVLLKTLVKQFGDFPACSPLAVAMGPALGNVMITKPNMVRAILAEDILHVFLGAITVLECEIDDNESRDLPIF